MAEKFTFFWKSGSPFSQWHMADFVVNGISFTCCEQFMMWSKAMLFGDKKIASDILKAKEPKEHKALGRKVRNFKKDVWEANCKRIVYEGNYAKFTQNKHLLEKLMATKGTTLVEASPYDDIWGIGLEASHPHAKNRATWRGTNWLGEVLTKLREDLEASLQKS